ncbi:glycosyltransferase [Bacillus pumilus]|uniref:glycosyltransferase family 2 protein n=2 Tax=Bacillaceae TaxID=186817 RepID=UPI00067FEC1A|nr:glycosyltransferase [Bacillus pumilus]KMY19333.1 glycosyltransferase [Bacillus pumilus]MCI4618585.1 glycosyltransferase family 2 protein [Bacillus pumilus]MCM3149037.1 glycosyltransferase family 2 protein [Bacillus pumilus]PRS29514.1 glycosyltransferase family 2 protein [Bacillus pumilus]TKI22050.1 glycosyltransferase family 2 protein [Bacillus pumilus]
MADVLFYLSLMLIWIMLLYHMFLMQGGFQHYLTYEKVLPKWTKQGKELPTVSILIPAHNEEVVIRQTLKAMVQLSYPKHLLEIIVINDNSSDRTGEIVQSFSEQYDHVHMIETKPPFAGKGKSTALNEGLKASTGEVICVYDADNMPEPKAVYYLVLGLLNDPKAGAVVGKFRVINATKNLLTKFINIETICFQWMAQGGRWKWFGIATIPGTNFAIRRHILEELGGWDVQALAEDTELTIRVYNLGYVIRFFPAAITWEQEPETWKVWWRQRTRWARGNQYVVLKFLRQFMKLKRKRMVFDLFYFFFTYFLFFFGVLLSNGIFIVNLFVDLHLSVGAVALILWGLAFFLFLTEVMITLSIEKTELTKQNILIVVLMYFTYSQVWIALVVYSLCVEVKSRLLKQEVKWYKTERYDQQQKKSG